VRGARSFSLALALAACSSGSPQATPAPASTGPSGAGTPASGTGGAGGAAGSSGEERGGTSTGTIESFAWALDNDEWQARVGSIQGAFDQAAAHDGVAIDVAFVRKFYDRVVPGIDGDLDGPAMLPAIAPRPLLAVNGDVDPRTPAGGLQLCEAAAKAAYAGNDDHFQLYREPNTAHAVTAQATTMTVDWFVRWLAP